MVSFNWLQKIAHSGGNEAGVDHVLIKPFLLCYVNVVLMLTSIFLSKIYIRKGRRFVSNKVNLTFTQKLRHLKPTTVKWPIRRGIEANEKYFE